MLSIALPDSRQHWPSLSTYNTSFDLDTLIDVLIELGNFKQFLIFDCVLSYLLNSSCNIYLQIKAYTI